MVDPEISFKCGHPRDITVHRTTKGFGFTLRHFVVYTELDSANRIVQSGEDEVPGSGEMMDTIFVKQVTSGGPAYEAGLRKGDRILAVNGQCVTGKSYAQVVALMQASDRSLKLMVEPKDGDMLQSKYESSAYAKGDKPYSGKAGDIPDPPKLSWKTSELQHTANSGLEVTKGHRADAEQTRVDTGLSKPSHKSFDSERKNFSLDSSLEAHLVSTSPLSSSSSDSKEAVKGGPPPPVQSRTSSRNVLLKYPLAYPRPYMEMGQQRAGSLDSICNTLSKASALGDHANKDTLKADNYAKYKAPELRSMRGDKSWHSQRSENDRSERRPVSTSEQRKRFFESQPHSIQLPDTAQEDLEVRSLPADTAVFTGKARPHSDTGTSVPPFSGKPYSLHDTVATSSSLKSHTLHNTETSVSSHSGNPHPLHDSKLTGAPRDKTAPRAAPSRTEAPQTVTSVRGPTGQNASGMDSDDYGIAVSLNNIRFLQDVNLPKTVPEPLSSQSHKTAKEGTEKAEFVSKQKRKFSLDEQISGEYHSEINSGRNFSVSKAFTDGDSKELFLDHRSSWSSVSTSSSLQHSLPAQDINKKLATSSDPIPYYSPKPSVERRAESINPVISQDEADAKLARRTSYLMATRQRFSADSESSTTEQQSPEPQLGDSSGKGSRQQKNIKKLKAFFGEKTPKIMEAHKVGDEPSSPLGDLVMEGQLNCKLAMTDGKKASDRSWKPMWAVLRGHVLLLYKDKSSVNPLVFEELPISIKSSIIDIAYDYTKKKNVFRLTTYNGSEYLFQAEEQKTMLAWIQAMHDHSNPDRDKSGVSKEELINRKIQQVSCQERSPSGIQQSQLKVKQKSTRALRSKSPAASSPAVKQKRQPYREEIHESPKTSKTWKGKMVRRFRRSGSSSTSTIGESSEMGSQATFGVSLEYCPSSTFSEYIPFVVEVCTKMVEVKGLEIQGIYRVPGNNGAVNLMQAEIDKGPDLVDMDNEKWLDVYVVGSLLKSFFRKLPEPLITGELYDAIIQANRTDDQEKRMLKLKKVIHSLPEHNFETFHYLAQHLHRVIEKEADNKMDARNIAIVFGPTLIRTVDDSMVTMVKDMSDQCRIIESIVSHPEWFFSSWDEDVYVPVESEVPGIVPISGMNQTLIHKAENMQLGERGREFSAKDLMSSVFSAANKKVRRRDRYKGTESIDVELESDVSYNERNIDAEIELRSKKQAEKTEVESVHSVQSQASVQSPTQLTDTSQASTRTDSRPKTAVSDCTSDSHSTNTQSQSRKEVIDAHNLVAGGKLQQTQSMSRSYNKERSQRDLHTAKMAFIQKTPEPVSLGPQHIDRSVMEHRAREQEELKLEVKRYPAYTAPDFRSFSTETSKPVIHYKYSSSSREITPPPRSLAVSQSRGHLPSSQRTFTDQHEKERRQREQAKLRIEMELQKTRKELEQEDEVNDQLSTSYSLKPQIVRYRPGGSQGINTSMSQQALKAARSCYDDMDVTCYSRERNRTETDVNKGIHRGFLEQRTRHIGSLDSLLNHYEKVEQSHYDSDSDQDDFLQKLTSAFDMKLRSIGDQYSSPSTVHAPVPGQVILAQGNKQQFVPSSFVEKFRDPSLHRVTPPKGDPNIGIACRFERRDIDSVNSSRENRHQASTTVREPSTDIRANSTPLSESQTYFVLSGSSNSVNLKSNPEIDYAFNYKPLVSHSKGYTSDVEKSGKLLQIESDKKGINVDNNVSSQADNSVSISNYSDRSVGTAKYLNNFVGRSNYLDDSMAMSRLSGKRSSPPSSLLRKKKDRRRHTVGGTHDVEHYAALLALTQPLQPPQRSSAWDRLQPATKQEPRNMQAWLKQQRLKNVKSTPSLISTEPSSSFEFYKFDHFSPQEQKKQRHSQRGSESVSELPSSLSPTLQLSRPFTFESSI